MIKITGYCMLSNFTETRENKKLAVYTYMKPKLINYDENFNLLPVLYSVRPSIIINQRLSSSQDIGIIHMHMDNYVHK